MTTPRRGNERRVGESAAGREQATVIILAGGRSVRMGGQPKSQLPWAGGTVLEYITGQAQQAGEETLVVGGGEMEVPAGARGVADIYQDCGPLGGLHAGLTAAGFQRCLAVGADMPFVRAEIMRALLRLGAEHDAAVPRTSEGIHPLFAAYSRNCLPAIAQELKAGNRRMTSFLNSVHVCWVIEEQLRQLDPDLLFLFNINTWQDYQQALKLAGTEGKPERR